MSWLQASEDDKTFVIDLAVNNQPIYKVLRILALANHVEPLLLRNTRLAYVPQSNIELEADIWFYEDIIQSRNALGLVFRGGIARALVDHFEQNEHEPEKFAQAKAFVERHTRHWKPRDRLEQQLRWYARENKQNELKKGFQQLLYTLTQLTDPEKRHDFTRWLSGALPQLTKTDGTTPEEAYWLNHYVAVLLGSAGKRLADIPVTEPPAILPAWLTSLIPTRDSHPLGLRLYGNGLECLAAEDAEHVIDIALPLPTPALLQTEPDGKQQWQGLWPGHKISLAPQFNSVLIQTLDGKRYRLKAVKSKAPEPGPKSDFNNSLLFVYMPEDREQAYAIKKWLSAQGIRVKLVEQPPEPDSSPHPSPVPVVQLWTQSTARYWQSKTLDTNTSTSGLLLRTDETVEIPLSDKQSPTQVLDLPGWHGEKEFAGADKLLNTVNALLKGQSLDELNHPPESETRTQLIKELKIPTTSPERRLEIGDLLAKMGDTRPGVGLAQFSAKPEYSSEVKELLETIASLKTEPPTRLKTGDQLAELGDPRPGVGLDDNGLPDIDWVEIPAGGFIYDEDKEQQTLTLETFYMARYPVTNSQYQAFIDAGAYNNKRWWEGLGKPKPKKSTWPQDNRPRTNVNWHEAVAFSRWLSEQLGYKVRLPTEQEWEKAARGPDGRAYPWGNDYQSGFANLNEKFEKVGPWDLKQTSAVGMYPHGASPYGVDDMAGNVKEWCLIKYDDPQNTTIDDSGTLRVMRGGSWYYFPNLARASDRVRFDPVSRYDFIGFSLLSSLTLCTPSITDRFYRLRFVKCGEGALNGAWLSGPRGTMWSMTRNASFLNCRYYCILRAVCFNQPPNKRPTSVTMRLTCSYCPTLSQCQ